MSLINQMLKDLEKRSSLNVDANVALSNLGTTSAMMLDEQDDKVGLLKKLVILLLICFVLLFSIWMLHKNDISTQKQKIHPMQATESAAVSQPLQHSEQALHPATMLTMLMGIALQVQPQVTNLRFLLNQSTLYKVEMDEAHHQLTISFDRTNLVADLPILNYTQSAIENLAISNASSGDLKIIITLRQNASLQHLDLVDTQDSPELQIDFNYKIPAEVASVNSKPDLPNVPIKQPVSAEGVEEQYATAEHFLNTGRKGQAIELLTKITREFPTFTAARQTLVALLIQQGDTQRAANILSVGLEQQPYLPAFVELKARLLIAEGKVPAALKLLQASPPALKQNPDYHAFIAALYQQTKQYSMAAQVYEQLLALNSSKAVWWTGLGIALESLGKQADANEAYAHAQTADELTPELRAFVDNRLESS